MSKRLTVKEEKEMRDWVHENYKDYLKYNYDTGGEYIECDPDWHPYLKDYMFTLHGAYQQVAHYPSSLEVRHDEMA